MAVEEVPDPEIEAPDDAVIRITTTNICGSDLHIHEGRAEVEQGKVLGHENLGIVEETGPGVSRIKPGDPVSVPFNIACGTCRNCVTGWTAFCLATNPVEGVDGAQVVVELAQGHGARSGHGRGPGIARGCPGPAGTWALRVASGLRSRRRAARDSVMVDMTGSLRAGGASPLL
ncbi:MAG TPA: alcohol dehydrogenase catalytic domain-containing protein [Streptosporangiaceae bacterium]|nr:alcohol dehydrogenase catalytic domain-containing protein [Streptosporangiaceae bacterium]